jgi:hypothetical protein
MNSNKCCRCTGYCPGHYGTLGCNDCGQHHYVTYKVPSNMNQIEYSQYQILLENILASLLRIEEKLGK